jgi:integrase
MSEEATTKSKLEYAVLRSTKLRPRTKELYARCIRSFIAFAGDDPERWTSTRVRKWRDSMYDRAIKAQSINIALNALRFAARRWLGTPTTFVDEVEMLPRKRRQITDDRTLTYSESRRLIIDCTERRPRDLRDAAIIVLGLRTGMLRFSLCLIDLDDLGWRTARALKKPALSELTFTRKGGERYTIKLDEETCSALTPWVEWLANRDITSGPLFRSLSRPRDNGRIAVGSEGLTPDGLYRMLRQRAERARIRDADEINPYVFRSTFLAWAQKAGAEPYQIAAVIGSKADGSVGDGPPANMLIRNFMPE